MDGMHTSENKIMCKWKEKIAPFQKEIVSKITVAKRLPDTQGEDRMRER